jgi:hypothetical protein
MMDLNKRQLEKNIPDSLCGGVVSGRSGGWNLSLFESHNFMPICFTSPFYFLVN